MTRAIASAFILGLLQTAVLWWPEAARTTPYQAPKVLPEPAYTLGPTNLIRWQPFYAWFHPGGHTQFNKDEGFLVAVQDLTAGTERSVVVSGEGATSAIVTGLVGGHLYSYVIRARERICAYAFFKCVSWGNLNPGPASSVVVSRQDAQAPYGTLALAGGKEFTASTQVSVRIDAVDPPGNEAASGVGFVQFSETGSFSCPLFAVVCAAAFFTSETTVNLSPGPDGPRTLYARLFDRALGASAAPVVPLFGLPAGNVSGALSDTVLLDTHGPKLVATRSAEPAIANVAVVFNGSGSIDAAGFGADSGIDPATARWDFGDGATASGLAATHAYATAGTFNASLSMSDRVGNASRLELAVTVISVGPLGKSTTTSGTPSAHPEMELDRTPPVLTGLKLRRSGSRATLVFTLSEPATVLVEAVRLQPAPAVLASFTRPGAEGANSLSLPSKLGAQLAKSGRYRLIVAAADAARNVSPGAIVTVRTAR